MLLLTYYFDTVEKHAERVRNLPNRDALYDTVSTAWKADPLMKPLPGDIPGKAAYFEKCDKIISQSTPVTTPEQYVPQCSFPSPWQLISVLEGATRSSSRRGLRPRSSLTMTW